MDKETYEALKTILWQARLLYVEKWGKRKRLTLDETFKKAVFTRDLFRVESWIDEVAKEY